MIFVLYVCFIIVCPINVYCEREWVGVHEITPRCAVFCVILKETALLRNEMDREWLSTQCFSIKIYKTADGDTIASEDYLAPPVVPAVYLSSRERILNPLTTSCVS